VIIDEDEHAMEVVVPDDQLSLAIGKRGQNVRLAHRLSGWKIDLRSDSEAEEEARAARASLNAIPGIGDINAELLYQWGFRTAEQLAETSEESFEVEGISPERARQLIMAAREWVAKKHTDEEAAAVAAAQAAVKKADADAAVAASADEAAAEAANGGGENGDGVEGASVSEEEDAAAKS
jgi:N utilization substance protein A